MLAVLAFLLGGFAVGQAAFWQTLRAIDPLRLRLRPCRPSLAGSPTLLLENDPKTVGSR